MLWKQTSYNTYGGTHKSGGSPFRKNFARDWRLLRSAKRCFYTKKMI
jgi:hypothetical protein